MYGTGTILQYLFIPSAGVKSKSLIFTDPVIGSRGENWEKQGG